MQLLMGATQLGCADDVGLETFKQGAALPEEEQPHASPREQWSTLAACLPDAEAISQTGKVMREICAAVAHEVVKAVRLHLCCAVVAGIRDACR